MSQAAPTICFRSGGLQEMIVHAKTGLICEEETAECLARNICRLLDDPVLRDECAHAALRRYQELYSDARVREGWMALFGVKA